MAAVTSVVFYALYFFFRALKFGVGKVFFLFSSKWRRWVLITFFVIYPHIAQLKTFVTTLNPLPLIFSVGRTLAHADTVVATQVSKILAQSMTGIEYVTAIVVLISAFATIAWYFRAFKVVGDAFDVATVFSYPIAFVIYALTVVAVRQEAPFKGIYELITQFEHVFNTARIYGNASAIGSFENVTYNASSNASASFDPELVKSIFRQ